jgi:hypothetical protein
MATTAAFDLEWPTFVEDVFKIYRDVGESAESFVSFDCFLQDTVFTNKGSSLIYFKTLLIVLSPLLIAFAFGIVFYLWKLYKGHSSLIFKRQVMVSSIVVIYALHSTVTR